MSRGGPRLAKVFEDYRYEPLDFVLRPHHTAAPGTGQARYHPSEIVSGWHDARVRILALLARGDVQKVAVADQRDARVVLVRYWPGDAVPMSGPDPAPEHPVLSLLASQYFGTPQQHRDAFAALLPYLKT